MADVLTQFGMGDSRFLFATYPLLWQDKLSPERFDDMAANSITLPGLDGVFPTNYMSRGRTSSTTIALRFQYTGEDDTDFTALKKALHQMKSHGLTYLFKLMEDDTLVFTLAQCTRVHVDSDSDNLAYVWPRGELNFFCPKARWYGKEGMKFLDNGLALDDTLTLIAPQIDRVTVDSGDIVELTNNGDAPAGVFIWLEAPAGETVENPSLSRMSIDGVSNADEIEYVGTLDGGGVVILDARNHQAQLNYSVFAADGYGNVNALRATWLEIPPGTSELLVGGTFSDGMILTLDLWDTYY
jgi:Phage tail protein.